MSMREAIRTEQDLCFLVLKLLTPIFERAGVDIGSFDPDQDLYDSGIIDSFDLVELLADLEEETGLAAQLMVDVDTNALTLSVNRIVRSLLEKRPEPQG